MSAFDDPEAMAAQELQELRESHAELLNASRGVLDAFNAGVFVRNTAHDYESGWAIKAFPHLRKLGQLQSAVAIAEKLK